MAMLQHSGSAYAYSNYVKNKLSSASKAEISSLILSPLFFIDDYFSSLTVGSVMQPVTDIFKIPRVKLGLMVNTMAVSFVILIPLSSWIAAIFVQLKQTGISLEFDAKTAIISDPFFAYIQTIPFLFYAVISVFSIWFMVLKRISFGVIASHEQVAEATGNLFGGKNIIARSHIETYEETHSTLLDFILPIAILIIFSIFEILRCGDFFLLGGNNSFIQALFLSNIPAALFKASLVTILISLIYFLIRGSIKIKTIPSIFCDGISLMWRTLIVLVLLWAFSAILRYDLNLGSFIAQNLTGLIKICFLPVIFFATSVIIAMLIGSAWAAFGLLIPIGVPMLVTLSQIPTPVAISQLPMLFPLLGAIISGSVAGAHLSPISDVMLMSATSSGCYHIDLVRAQSNFAIPTIFSASISFLISGLLMQNYGVTISLLVSLFIGTAINFTIFYLLSLMQNKLKN
jgi:Na+/H+ antiporter NhaC